MNSLVNIVMRAVGLGKAVDALDGEASKAYVGGLGTMLAGAAGVLAALANLLGEVLPLHGGAEYLKFVQGLSHNPNMAAILLGVAAVSKGLADIGNRHAVAKLADSQKTTAPPPPQP